MEGGVVMREIPKEQLKKVEGGGIGFWGVCGLIALGAFLIGVFDGIARPVECG